MRTFQPSRTKINRECIRRVHHRRQRGDMISIYQNMTDGLDVRPNQFFEPAVSSFTRGHRLKLRKLKPQVTLTVKRNTNSQSHQQLECPSSPSVVLSDTLNQLKFQLDSHWAGVMSPSTSQSKCLFKACECSQTGARLDAIGTQTETPQAKWQVDF